MRWFLLTSTVKSIRILQFYQPAHSNKNQITEKQELSSKNTHALLSEDKRNKFPHRFLGIVMVSISLSDKNIKLLEK